MQNYNVLFMGTSKFAVPILEGLLESSVNIQAVFSAPPKLANRGMKQTLSPVAKFAEEYQLPLEYPTILKYPEIINKVNELLLIKHVFCKHCFQITFLQAFSRLLRARTNACKKCFATNACNTCLQQKPCPYV